jgi:hypothetical protein
MTHSYYNTTDHLTGTMLEFGKYTLKYEPPGETPEDHSVAMTISSEANLTQMLEFFNSFLRAAGYEFDGKELCLEREAPDFSFLDNIANFGTNSGASMWRDHSNMGSYGPSYWGGYPDAGTTYKGAEGAQATGGN